MTRLRHVPADAALRPDAGLLAQGRPAAGAAAVERAGLGGPARAGLPAAPRHCPRRTDVQCPRMAGFDPSTEVSRVARYPGASARSTYSATRSRCTSRANAHSPDRPTHASRGFRVLFQPSSPWRSSRRCRRESEASPAQDRRAGVRSPSRTPTGPRVNAPKCGRRSNIFTEPASVAEYGAPRG